MVFWLLAREVQILRGGLGKNQDWDVMVDLFFYKKIDDAIKAEEEEAEGEEKLPEEKGKKKWDTYGQEAGPEGEEDQWA